MLTTLAIAFVLQAPFNPGPPPIIIAMQEPPQINVPTKEPTAPKATSPDMVCPCKCADCICTGHEIVKPAMEPPKPHPADWYDLRDQPGLQLFGVLDNGMIYPSIPTQTRWAPGYQQMAVPQYQTVPQMVVPQFQMRRMRGMQGMFGSCASGSCS